MDGFEEGGWVPSNPEEREAWRGSEPEDPEAWRGTEPVETWPEEMAGPEYWLFRAREEVERVVSELVGERTALEE